MAKAQFQDALQQLNDLRHSQAVWEEVAAHLRKFVDTDAAPAKSGIVTTGMGLVVPQPIVAAVIEQIQNDILAPLLKDIARIEHSKVEGHEPKNPRKAKSSPRKAASPSRPAQAESDPGTAGSSGN
jgi:hypothetical protein